MDFGSTLRPWGLAVCAWISISAAPLRAEVLPVVLIHGIWGGEASWRDYAEHLKRAGYAEPCRLEFDAGSARAVALKAGPPPSGGGSPTGSTVWTPLCESSSLPAKSVVRLVFRDADGQSLAVQGSQVAAGVAWLRQKTGSAKVILIGHSMGGLAARAYLQGASYRNDVERLVTVNTPHLGSLLPYLLEDLAGRDEAGVRRALEAISLGHLSRSADAASTLLRAYLQSKLSRRAVQEVLRPDCAELTSLNRPSGGFSALPPEVEYVSVFSQWRCAAGAGCHEVEALTEPIQRNLASYFDPSKVPQPVVGWSGSVLANWTDGVVPVVSQLLQTTPVGVALPVITEQGRGTHTEVPDDQVTWEVLDRHLGRKAPKPAPAGPLSVALILDSSGSMDRTDPAGLRREGARLLVERSPAAGFAVVDFDSSARRLVSVGQGTEAVRRAISAIDAAGETAICRGLAEGAQALAEAPAGAKAAVLFTDGESTVQPDVCTAEEFARQGWRLFTVGLSLKADGPKLQRLAAEGNGAYVHAISSQDLQRLFDVVASELLDEATLLDVAGSVTEGGTERIAFRVDGSMTTLTGTLSWPGSDLDLVFVSPRGERFAAASGASGATWETARVAQPEAGEWRAEVVGVSVSPGGEPFRLRIGGDSPIRLRPRPLAAAGTGEALELVAELSGSPAGATRADLEVENPKGVVSKVPVEVSGSSLRGLFTETYDPGPYTVRWSVRTGELLRAAVRSVFVGGQAFDPRRGPVRRVEGSYLVWARGASHGLRSGMAVRFLRGGREVGRGQVLSMRATESDVEVFEFTGGIAGIEVGDVVALEAHETLTPER